jgi:hypothetical protein
VLLLLLLLPDVSVFERRVLLLVEEEDSVRVRLTRVVVEVDVAVVFVEG